MADDGGLSLVEEVEDAVVDPVELNPQLVEFVAEGGRAGAVQFVAELFEQIKTCQASEAGLIGQTGQPLAERDGTIVVRHQASVTFGTGCSRIERAAPSGGGHHRRFSESNKTGPFMGAAPWCDLPKAKRTRSAIVRNLANKVKKT